VPGGGSILFLAGQGESVAVIRSNGRVESVASAPGDLAWDPAVRGAVIVRTTATPHVQTRLFERRHGRWVRTRRWRAGADYYGRLSPDGRWMVSNAFRHGQEQTTIHAIRRDGRERVFPGSGGHPLSWTPDGGGVLIDAGPETGLVRWDIASGAVRSFLTEDRVVAAIPGAADAYLDDANGLSWSPLGGYFVTRLYWMTKERPRSHSGILVGSSSGEVVSVVPLHRWTVTIPTWSPVRPEFVFYDKRHRLGRGTLFRFDLRTRRRYVVIRHAPETWWVAWSPRGDWMLLSAYHRDWLFVSRDGRRRVRYPMEGEFPRWATPGPEILMPVC
jgi:hypothetical protein